MHPHHVRGNASGHLKPHAVCLNNPKTHDAKRIRDIAVHTFRVMINGLLIVSTLKVLVTNALLGFTFIHRARTRANRVGPMGRRQGGSIIVAVIDAVDAAAATILREDRHGLKVRWMFVEGWSALLRWLGGHRAVSVTIHAIERGPLAVALQLRQPLPLLWRQVERVGVGVNLFVL